jgi:hypothetical protein
MSNNLGNFLEDYNDLLSDLGEIDAFDLNWDHKFMCCSENYFATNFGVMPLYAIDGTGHDFLGIQLDNFFYQHYLKKILLSIEYWIF